MTMTAGTELTEGTRGLVSRLAAINEQKAALEAEERLIKAELRANLDVGQWTWNGTPVLSLAPNRRFSAEKAAQVLPPELLALCRSDKVDSTQAKKVLPPALYAQCQDVAGEPVVRVL